MRALVLGGGGMLGRAVVAQWRRCGQAVLGLGHAQADVTDPAQVRYWTEQFRPQLLINCAAMTQVDACETQRERAFAVNGRAVVHLVQAAERVGARLIQVSTDYVFAGQAVTPYPETAPTGPQSVYGESKLAGEVAALGDPRGLIVRTSWLFGPGGPNFVLTIRRLLLSGQELRVVDDQVGCPTATPSLARALWDLAVREATGVWHYRDREAVSWFGFAQEIARAVAPQARVVPVKTAEFPRPAQRPAYSVLDVTRFESAVSRRVAPWTQGLAAYLEFLGEHS